MTIRQLLQGLHKLAGELGADTDVEIVGPSLHLKVHEVRAGTVGPYPVALIQTRTRKIVANKNKHLRKTSNSKYQKAYYAKHVESGTCYSCKAPLGESKTLQCESCSETRRVKARQRLADKRKLRS